MKDNSTDWLIVLEKSSRVTDYSDYIKDFQSQSWELSSIEVFTSVCTTPENLFYSKMKRKPQSSSNSYMLWTSLPELVLFLTHWIPSEEDLWCNLEEKEKTEKPKFFTRELWIASFKSINKKDSKLSSKELVQMSLEEWEDL